MLSLFSLLYPRLSKVLLQCWQAISSYTLMWTCGTNWLVYMQFVMGEVKGGVDSLMNIKFWSPFENFWWKYCLAMSNSMCNDLVLPCIPHAQWRLKDRGLYNMLLMLRTGYAGCKQLWWGQEAKWRRRRREKQGNLSLHIRWLSLHVIIHDCMTHQSSSSSSVHQFSFFMLMWPWSYGVCNLISYLVDNHLFVSVNVDNNSCLTVVAWSSS